MTNRARLGLVAAAVVVAVGAFVLLNPDDDSDKADEPGTPAAQTTPAETGDETAPTATAPSAPPPPPERIAVVGGAPKGGVQRIVVGKGDSLRLVVSSDSAHEIHLHGYDVARDAAPGRPARFRLKTDIEGVFEIEVEDTGTKIGDLVVEPS